MLLDDKTLFDLQSRLMDLMQKVHSICVENDIHYTMMGGTLIGALRHQGFIPWDDDIDIGMPYEDYEKFVKIVASHKYEGLSFGIPGKTDDYYQAFVKVFDTNTTLMENNRTKSKPKGIFIDVFPITHVGNSKLQAYWNVRIHRFWRDILTRKDLHLCQGLFILVEWIYIFLGKVIPANFAIKKIYARYAKLSKKKTLLAADLDSGRQSG